MSKTKVILKIKKNVIKDMLNGMDKKTGLVAIKLRDMTKLSMGTPGFPKIKTGNLKASIREKKRKRFSYKVFTDMFYAGYVEFGTSKASAYLYFRPNINRLKRLIPGIYEARK